MMVRGGTSKRHRAMTASATAHPTAAVSLVQVELDLHRWLTAKQVNEAQRWALPLLAVDLGAGLSTVLQRTDAFGALLFTSCCCTAFRSTGAHRCG